MLRRSGQMDRFDQIERKIQSASAVTADLVSSVIDAAGERRPVLDRAGNAAPLRTLIGSGAWTDVALAVVEIEFPQWKLRRIVFEDGKWQCFLSKQAYLPAGLDDSVEAAHEILPLAILRALVEARHEAHTKPKGQRRTPQHRSAPEHTTPRDNLFCVIACDNFS